jgi:tetratricopeptide (TPR) repeat protein
VAIGDDDDDKSRKLKAWWRSECVGMRPDGLALIAELLSLPITGPDTRIAWSPQKRKQMLLDLVVERVATLAARKPVLLVLEDAHWIDPTTHEWLDIMIDRVRSLPVLAIVTYRPEFDPSWRGQAHVTTLTLNRLVPRDSASLARSIAKEGDLSALLEEIVARTDGVPLFIEETTKSVMESGTMAVPATLQASLVARFDRLPAARGLVQIGAALGREFSYAAVRAVAGMPDAEVAPLMGQLAATELIHQRGTVPDAIYTFKHALVQDAAYSTMLAAQRARIHRRIVDTLEAQFAEETLRHPDVLAYHAGEAGLPEKALDYRIKAARMAVERSAGVESQGHVESGMALLQKIVPSPSRRQLEGRLMMALADALVMTRGFASPDVMAALSRARELLDPAAHPVESLRALCGVFQYHFIRSESPHSLAATEPFLDRDADAPTKTVIHYLVGATCLHLGQFARSTRLLESALSLYEEDSCRPVAWIAGHHVRPFTLMWLGLGRLYSGSVGEAAETVAAAVADARARSHPFTLVSTLLALARFRSHVRDLEGAASAIDEGMAIATEQRSPYHASRAAILRGVNLIDSGRARDGIALMMSALEAHRATGANFQSGYNLSKLAEGHAALGEFDRALDFAQQAVADVARTGERWWEAEALRLQGEILLASSLSRRAAAEERFAQALSCARSQDARLWELRAARSLSGSLLARGKPVDAQSLLKPVCARFAEDVSFAELASARADLRRMGPRVN